jgi:hypothetical protein
MDYDILREVLTLVLIISTLEVENELFLSLYRLLKIEFESESNNCKRLNYFLRKIYFDILLDLAFNSITY